ncbi:MAG: valine--pyruvate transaminase [Gammaproteobacteria bacterium]
MNERYSDFANRFLKPSGTKQLMDDLSAVANSDEPLINLGGGNPGLVPHAHELFRDRIKAMLDDRSIDNILRRYDGPQGHLAFRKALASQLSDRFGWRLSAENIALTAGSQTSFFMLFNAFAGVFDSQHRKQIMLPLAPEYIGYTDVGLVDDMIVSKPGTIELTSETTFKYHLDISADEIRDNVGLVCVSRPTNPTGNVITDQELEHLLAITKATDVPLIIDGAYGLPFPHIVFSNATPMWDEHVILCLSLSKLGLPGLRTGIVIADPETTHLLTSLNAIFSLANNSLGAEAVAPLLESGEVFEISKKVIKPFYEKKLSQAKQWIANAFEGLKVYTHESEGAIFLWLWFPDLPIDDMELYRRLKSRGVLVLPGSYFFPNRDHQIKHQQECIRLSYAQDPRDVEQGIGVIAEEVRRAYSGSANTSSAE